MSARPLAVVLDYSVIDHLQRLEAGRYLGSNGAALQRLRAAAECGRIDVWGSEITFVEMLLGIEKLEHLAGREEKITAAAGKDEAKRAIMESMRVRSLGYPCSRFDDEYSRCDVSFRFAGPNTDNAVSLEERLRGVPGVSEGDARQLVSCAYPFDGVETTFEPTLDWFIAEDRALIAAITTEVSKGALPELAHLRFGSVADLVSAHPADF